MKAGEGSNLLKMTECGLTCPCRTIPRFLQDLGNSPNDPQPCWARLPAPGPGPGPGSSLAAWFSSRARSPRLSCLPSRGPEPSEDKPPVFFFLEFSPSHHNREAAGASILSGVHPLHRAAVPQAKGSLGLLSPHRNTTR